MEPLGLIQWKSHTVPIVQMKLCNGGISAKATGVGPFEVYEGPVDIYGADGFFVGGGGRVVVPKVKGDDYLTLNIEMSLSSTTFDE